jgi:hypothetical protein
MSSIAEALATQKAPLAAALSEGVTTISRNQEIVFTQYTRQVLPIDGWIFWLKTGQTIKALGSLHYSTDLNQNEDETFGQNSVVFTTMQPLQAMDAVSPQTLYIGTIDNIKFSFKRRSSFYKQADLYHYQGDAINPAMQSQLIDSAASLDLTNVVVTNSLPLWIALPNTSVVGKTTPAYTIYPSFLVPQNLVPPYIVAHVPPELTEAMQSAPLIESNGTHWQLASDKVKLTFYGLRNNEILDFQDYLFQYSLNTDNIGIMNMPIVRDEKRTQAEMGIIGMKKSMEIEVSYYQSRVNTVTQQLIASTTQHYFPKPL